MRYLTVALALLLIAGCSAAQVAAPQPSPTAGPSLAERGALLFVNKGCITCHEHAGVGYEGTIIGVGPALTSYQAEAGFLREWLRNPAAVRPGTGMPTLGLSEPEIDALIAFLAE